jgi:protocatechuate 4,5-dioxygenase alpha chain
MAVAQPRPQRGTKPGHCPPIGRCLLPAFRDPEAAPRDQSVPKPYQATSPLSGFYLNEFCMSLMKPENRERFKADERAYLDEWPMTEAQKQAVLDRDYNAMLDLGGNIYFLAKIFATDGLSYLQAVSTMTGMNIDDYQQMMLSGGRSPAGWRSVKDGT